MNPFVKFMASPAGRITRIVAGIVLIVLGLFVIHGVGGIILAIVGLVPLVAGLVRFLRLRSSVWCPHERPENPLRQMKRHLGRNIPGRNLSVPDFCIQTARSV